MLSKAGVEVIIDIKIMSLLGDVITPRLLYTTVDYTCLVQPKPYHYDNPRQLSLECEYLAKVKYLAEIEIRIQSDSRFREYLAPYPDWCLESAIKSKTIIN